MGNLYIKKSWLRSRKAKGSHIRLHSHGKTSITVPNHIVGIGLLHKILRDAEFTPEEFNQLILITFSSCTISFHSLQPNSPIIPQQPIYITTFNYYV